MPDLDQLLDTLVADVRAGTRAPGAPMAIQQAHRRRGVVAAVAAVTVIAAGSGLAAGTLDGSKGPSSLAGPTTPSPEPTKVRGDTDSDEAFATELRRALTEVPGWAVTEGIPMNPHSCGGDWASGATGAGGGRINVATSGAGFSVWSDEIGFPTAAQASDAVDRLVENLESCAPVSWRTEPIAQTGAVLAFSDAAVIWIHKRGSGVSTLQVPTTNGPPPPAVRTRVADLIYTWSD